MKSQEINTVKFQGSNDFMKYFPETSTSPFSVLFFKMQTWKGRVQDHAYRCQKPEAFYLIEQFHVTHTLGYEVS